MNVRKITYEIYMDESYKDKRDSWDEWGCACLYENGEWKLDYNYCFDEGESCCAIYRMLKGSDGIAYSTDTSTFKHYDIEWDKPDWEARLVNTMKVYLRELEAEEREMENEYRDQLINAVTEFSNAASRLNDLIEGTKAEELCAEGYPFNKSFNEMVLDINNWKYAFSEELLKDKGMNVVVYAADVLPGWDGDNNLWVITVCAKDFYDWWVEKYIGSDRKNTSLEAFMSWYEMESNADMTIGLYDYCKVKSGVRCVVDY